MEPNLPISDINGWQTVSHPRKKKTRTHNINTNRQNRNFKIPRKESAYTNVNFSSNLMKERFDEREYKDVSLKDKSKNKTLHDSSVGKFPRFTKPRKNARTNVAYETSTEFLSSNNKNRINQEFVENPLVETCATESVKHTNEFDSTSEKEIEQSKLSELKEAPMKQSYAEKCILNESLTERQLKNKGAFHGNSRPAQNYRNRVGAHESKPNGLYMTKLKKQKTTKVIISKSDQLDPVQNKVNDVINIKENQKVAASFMSAENLSSIKIDAQDEYKHYENRPLTKYLKVRQNTENIRCDCDNNAEASNIPSQRCDCDNAEASNILSERYEWDNNVEASNIPSQRCDCGNAEASNIPSQRCELDSNVEANGVKSPLCDWENNTESGNIRSQRCDWDNNTEESSVPSQQCDWDNAEASNIESQRCDWDNSAEISAIPSQQYDLDNNAEVNAIPSQRCEWGNNDEANNKFQRYNGINSENGYFLQSESASIVPLNPENTGSGFRSQFEGSIILGIPNPSFDNGMQSSIYSNQFQNFMTYDQKYYQEHATNAQGSGNSNNRQNNPNAIYNSVVSGMPSRPFALSWTDGGVVYFQYYQNISRFSCPCFVVGRKILSHSPLFVPYFDVNFPYTSNLENTVK